MKAFVVAAQDFKQFFKISENGQEFTAIQDESKADDQTNKKSRRKKSNATYDEGKSRETRAKKTNKTQKIRKAILSSSEDSESGGSDTGSKRKFDDYWNTSSSDDSDSRKRLKRVVY